MHIDPLVVAVGAGICLTVVLFGLLVAHWSKEARRPPLPDYGDFDPHVTRSVTEMVMRDEGDAIADGYVGFGACSCRICTERRRREASGG